MTLVLLLLLKLYIDKILEQYEEYLYGSEEKAEEIKNNPIGFKTK